MAYTSVVNFEWDSTKDLTNQEKHGVSFAEAKKLFEASKDYLEIFDSDHSDAEDRFIAIGEIKRGIALVVFTERDEDLIRIIGARFATKREREAYHAYLGQQL